ncbi:hypothetical protein CERSUDRAFT_114903 [Gelatoporia subvermispora B]|uniref:Proteophosphoglycan ppg4 n=1 Tax=Ceriporiopsis subvermispora (strain B) TaxID=914234 RepID=M2RDX0_CERS8|nr:hypothetical protein CERSUDRAFT_114903 [Gelatoporia subvermispora B]
MCSGSTRAVLRRRRSDPDKFHFSLPPSYLSAIYNTAFSRLHCKAQSTCAWRVMLHMRLKCSRSTNPMIYATVGRRSPGQVPLQLALSILLLSTRSVLAAPSGDIVRRQSGRGSSSSNSVGPAIWVPLAIVATLLVVGTIVACFRRNVNVRGRWQSVSTGAAAASGTLTAQNAQSRELTAEQLAGEPPNGAGSARTRRPRRTRRTPSQISTTSLPVYMKEPGEQEVVIIRGPDDMEDEMHPTTMVMPPVDEYTSEGSVDLRHSVSFSYIAVTSPGDTPLLQNEGTDTNESQQHLRVHAQQQGFTTRSSFETIMSTDDVGMPPMNIAEDDSRGEAPPYFEVVTLDEQPSTSPIPPESTESFVPAEAPSSHDVQPGTNRRRTGFLSLFNPRTNSTRASQAAAATPPNARGHTRQESGLSTVSSRSSGDGTRPTHRPSHSAGSMSMLSNASHALRSISRARSRTELTSPSTISLHSISSPLSHTLMRSEFTYPRGGPTPEQLRLISSRESFVRFGVPYGAEAIAYAASASRVDLEPPPPVFEDVEGSPDPAHEDSEEVSSLQEISGPQTEESAPLSSQEPDSHPPDAGTEATSPPAGEEPQTASTSEPHAVPQHAAASEAATTAAASVEQQAPPPSAPPEQPKASLAAPPSAYKPPASASAPSHRSASRASSYMTFATADEFTDSSAPPTPIVPHATIDTGEPSDDELETPPTPRAETRHLREDTDMTVTS